MSASELSERLDRLEALLRTVEERRQLVVHFVDADGAETGQLTLPLKPVRREVTGVLGEV